MEIALLPTNTEVAAFFARVPYSVADKLTYGMYCAFYERSMNFSAVFVYTIVKMYIYLYNYICMF